MGSLWFKKESRAGIPGQHLEMVEFRNTEVGQVREGEDTTISHLSPVVSAAPGICLNFPRRKGPTESPPTADVVWVAGVRTQI